MSERRLPPDDRIHSVLLTAAGILFAALFAMLSLHNRLVIDDWDYLGSLAEGSVGDYVKYLYLSWSGRWAAYALTGAVVALRVLPWFNILSMAALYVVLAGILGTLFRRTGMLPGRLRLHQMAAVLCMALFFSSYSKGETWFWLVHVCVYLWSLIAALVLVRILFDERFRPAHALVVPAAALYAGGAAESFVLVDFVLLGIALAWAWRGRNPLTLPHRVFLSKVLLIALFLAVGFTLTMMAPGNGNRLSALPHMPWIGKGWVFLKSCIKIFFIRTPQQLPVLVLFSLPWLWWGHAAADGGGTISAKAFLAAHRYRFAGVVLLIMVCLVPTAAVMSELGPDRALAQVTFIVAFGMAWLFYQAGRRLHFPGGFGIARSLSLVLLVVFLAVTGVWQYRLVSAYSAAYDARWQRLERLNRVGHRGTVEVDPLPPSGFLSPGEITTDTNHFSNNFLEHALHLRFEVKRKELSK